MTELDILKIQPNKVSRDLRGKYLLIYGPPKSGKTTFCSTELPKPLLIALEKGYNAIPGVKPVDVEKWTDLKKIVKQLESPSAKEIYETIVFDTADILTQLCEKYISQQNGVKELGDVGYGALYKLYRREMSETFRKIAMMDYGVTFICQEEVKIVKDNQGNDIERLQPKLDKSGFNIINAMVDFILYIGTEWEDNVQKRYFYTRPTPFIVAGSRFKFIEPKIDFTYPSLINAISSAMDEDTEGRSELITDGPVYREDAKKRIFAEVMNEAGSLWAQFPKTEEWAVKKNEIVKEYFGQPIKLSTATESQQDLVESVIADLEKLLETVPAQ